MNSVLVEVRPPDQMSVKRGTELDAKNGIRYAAAFHKESGSNKKPVHYGSVLEVAIVDDTGKVQQMESRTVVLQDKGDGTFDIVLRGRKPVVSSLEQPPKAPAGGK